MSMRCAIRHQIRQCATESSDRNNAFHPLRTILDVYGEFRGVLPRPIGQRARVLRQQNQRTGRHDRCGEVEGSSAGAYTYLRMSSRRQWFDQDDQDFDARLSAAQHEARKIEVRLGDVGRLRDRDRIGAAGRIGRSDQPPVACARA